MLFGENFARIFQAVCISGWDNGCPCEKQNGRTVANASAGLICRKLFHPVKILLKNLPVFQAGDFALETFVNLGFLRILGRLVDFVENAEVAGERFAGQLVGRDFVGHVVVFRDFIERAAFARIARIKRTFVKFHTFAQTFDEAETVVIHRRFHHL